MKNIFGLTACLSILTVVSSEEYCYTNSSGWDYCDWGCCDDECCEDTSSAGLITGIVLGCLLVIGFVVVVVVIACSYNHYKKRTFERGGMPVNNRTVPMRTGQTGQPIVYPNAGQTMVYPNAGQQVIYQNAGQQVMHPNAGQPAMYANPVYYNGQPTQSNPDDTEYLDPWMSICGRDVARAQTEINRYSSN